MRHGLLKRPKISRKKKVKSTGPFKDFFGITPHIKSRITLVYPLLPLPLRASQYVEKNKRERDKGIKGGKFAWRGR